MRRASARIILLLTLLLTGVLGMVLALASTVPSQYHTELAQFLVSPDCQGTLSPCWQGIRVGDSTRAEVLAVLRNLRWVDQETIEENLYGVSWRWLSGTARFLTLQEFNRIEFDRDEGSVYYILLYGLQIYLGDLWAVGGMISSANLYVQHYSSMMTPPPPGFGIAGYAPTISANVFALVRCPLYPAHLWNTVITRLTYSSTAYGSSAPFLPGELYGQIHECQPQYDPT